MAHYKKIVFLGIFSLFSFAVFAEEKLVLTADKAVEKALEFHVDIKRSEISRGQAKREYKNSWNKVLPSVSAGVSASEKKSWKDSDSDIVNGSLSFSASLSLDAGIASSIKALRSSYEAGEISYEETVRKTESSVRTEFYRILYLKEQLENARKTLESYEKQFEQAKEKYSRGTVTQLDLLSAEVNVETAKPDVDSARTNFSNALKEFLDAIGIGQNSKVGLEGTLDDAERVAKIDRSVLEKCVENSSEVKILEKNLETAKHTKNATYSSLRLPGLNLSADVSPEIYSYGRKSKSGAENPSWSVSAGISLPVDSWIPGSSASVKIAALDDTIKDYEAQLENLKKTVKTSAAEKFEAIELSQKNIAARKMNVELAQKSYEMTEDAYRRGTKDLLSLQDALDKLSAAKLQLRSEQYALLSNVLSLQEMLSLPSETFFEAEKLSQAEKIPETSENQESEKN